jgi:hypothetical protein
MTYVYANYVTLMVIITLIQYLNSRNIHAYGVLQEYLQFGTSVTTNLTLAINMPCNNFFLRVYCQYKCYHEEFNIQS